MTINGSKTPLGITDPHDEAGAWAAFKGLIDKALNEKTTASKAKAATLVPAYLDALRDRDEPPAARTIEGYASVLRRFLHHFGNSAIGEIEPKLVARTAAAEGWSDSHRHNYLYTVQAFMHWAGAKEFTVKKPGKESRGAEAVISEEVFGKILRETTGDFHQLMRLLWQVGSRPMESGCVSAEMVDFATGTITLRLHKTKKHVATRVLYLNSIALAVLKEQVDRYQTGPLFRGLGGRPLSRHAVMTRMIRLSARIGHHVTAGQYRHTFATRALAAGIPDTHVAALLGHTSTRMIHKHYSHVAQNGRLLREAAEKLVKPA